MTREKSLTVIIAANVLFSWVLLVLVILMENDQSETAQSLVGWVAVVGAALSFGGTGLPMKYENLKSANVDPSVFSLYTALGLLLVCCPFIMYLTIIKQFMFIQFSLLGALFIGIIGYFAFMAVQILGYATAPAVWASIGMITSYLWGLLYFKEQTKSVLMSSVAIALLILGVLCVTFGTAVAKSTEQSSESRLLSRQLSQLQTAFAAESDEEDEEEILFYSNSPDKVTNDIRGTQSRTPHSMLRKIRGTQGSIVNIQSVNEPGTDAESQSATVRSPMIDRGLTQTQTQTYSALKSARKASPRSGPNHDIEYTSVSDNNRDEVDREDSPVDNKTRNGIQLMAVTQSHTHVAISNDPINLDDEGDGSISLLPLTAPSWPALFVGYLFCTLTGLLDGSLMVPFKLVDNTSSPSATQSDGPILALQYITSLGISAALVSPPLFAVYTCIIRPLSNNRCFSSTAVSISEANRRRHVSVEELRVAFFPGLSSGTLWASGKNKDMLPCF